MRIPANRTLWLVLAVLGTAGLGQADKKVTVCHFPPGNPANPQTISVGEAAVGAHLEHGDRLGECPTGCHLNAPACDDENACTADSCATSGECRHETVNCDDGNPCTTDSCSESDGCVGVPNDGAACNDGVTCTDRDACTGGECHGTAIPGCCTTSDQCGDGDACTQDLCVSGRCSNDARDCSVADRCLAGFCDPSSGCGTAPVTCDDTNVCTDDLCDSARGCYSQPTSNPPEASESSCADGVDNDCDGLVDTPDPDCSPQCDCPDCQYVSRDPALCAFIRWTCPEGYEAFTDECGCGCEPSSSGESCGAATCAAGEYCCNLSCGICALQGSFCNQNPCSP